MFDEAIARDIIGVEEDYRRKGCVKSETVIIAAFSSVQICAVKCVWFGAWEGTPVASGRMLFVLLLTL